MSEQNTPLTRVEWLLGEEALGILARTRVAVFGLGGVGGVCADALFRSGFGQLTLIDGDKFEITNQNRQLHSEFVGEFKALVFERIYRERAASAKAPPQEAGGIKGLVAKVDKHFFENFDLGKFDLIIDAIDDIPAKVALALAVDHSRQLLLSSTGGGKKLDPSQIRTASIHKSYGDALARKFRYELRRAGFRGDFEVVFSTEPAGCVRLGSFVGVTACFGLHLAALATRRVLAWCQKN